MRLLVLIVAVLASAACSGATETAAAPAPLCRVTVAATAERQAVATVRPLARRLWKALRAPGMSLAVAVDGRIAATTRAFRDGGDTIYAAVLPPSSLADGSHAVTVLEVLGDGRLRPIGGAGG